MHLEKYSLTWHAYSDHLKSMMKELMMNEDFSDITLVTEDKKQIKANRNILRACSPVFRDILKNENHSSTVMYLRGIQFSEMESILQFIYLGEATFYQERMDEFLAVAKLLEIKQLCNAKIETNDKQDDETLSSDPEASTGVVEEQIDMQEEQNEYALNDKYDCEQCHKTYSCRSSLSKHIKMIHQGVKVACDQCEYQASQKSDLNKHIQTKHEGVKYACGQCGSQFSQKGSLNIHIQSKHEGVKYTCDQCDYHFTNQSTLSRHVKSAH